MQEFSPELDAIVAAPGHHRLLLENDAVRVLDTRVEPGDTVPMHTHRWPASLYVLSWSDFIRRDGEGNVVLDSKAKGAVMKRGSAVWSEPLGPHTLENVGEAVLHIIVTEVKSAT